MKCREFRNCVRCGDLMPLIYGSQMLREYCQKCREIPCVVLAEPDMRVPKDVIARTKAKSSHRLSLLALGDNEDCLV